MREITKCPTHMQLLAHWEALAEVSVLSQENLLLTVPNDHTLECSTPPVGGPWTSSTIYILQILCWIYTGNALKIQYICIFERLTKNQRLHLSKSFQVVSCDQVGVQSKHFISPQISLLWSNVKHLDRSLTQSLSEPFFDFRS